MARLALIVLGILLPSLALADPVTAAITGAVEALGIGATIATAIGTFGTYLVEGLALTALQGFLAPRPRNQLRDITQMTRSSAEPRRVLYGTVMASGPLIYAANTGANNAYLHLIIALAGHEIDSIGAIYFNDMPVGSLRASDNGTFSAEPVLTNTGNATIAVGSCINLLDLSILLNLSVVFENPTTFNVFDQNGLLLLANQTYTSGSLITVSSRTFTITGVPGAVDSFFVTAVIVALDANGNVTLGQYAGGARIIGHLGSSTQTVDTQLQSECPQWDSTHRLQGIAYLYVRLLYVQGYYPGGVPNIKCVVKGRQVYDPRTSTTAWSNNWALCVRDYVTSSFGFGAQSAEIDDTTFIAAANAADEAVVLDSVGNTQARYTCDGAVSLDQTPMDIMKSMLSAAAGTVVFSQGLYKCFAGVYTSPTVTLTESDLRGKIKVTPKVARKSLFNAVRGTYVDPNKYWQPVDFPPVENTAYSTQDGELIYRDIALPFTTDPVRAQRIAKIHLEKSRQSISIEFPAKLTAFQLSVWDRVNVSIARFGWVNQVFLVTDWKFDGRGGVDLILQQEDPNSYNWNYGDATAIDYSKNTNLPDAFNVTPPTNLQATVAVYGQSGLNIEVSWTASTSIFVASYVVQYRQVTQPVQPQDAPSFGPWIMMPLVAGTSEVIPNLTHGDWYQIEVASINDHGLYSSWVSIDYQALYENVPPVSGLELFNGSTSTTFSGKDAKFVWRKSATTTAFDIGSEITGANQGGPDPYFLDFEVRIYNGTVLLRTEHTTDTFYTYAYEKNSEDNSGTPIRSFTIAVYSRAIWGEMSAIPAQLTVSNPPPDLPTAVDLRASFKFIFFGYTPAADTDYAGLIIWLSTVTGFTPGPSNLVYQGNDTLPVIDSQPGVQYFLRYGSYDAFGTAGMIISGEVTVTSGIVNTADIAAAAVQAANIAAGAVTAVKTALASIDQATGNIVANAVSSVQLAAGAVTAAKTAVAAIDPTSGNLTANSVTTTQLVAGSVVAASIAAGAITSTQIAAGSIVSSNIAAGTIQASNIYSGTITSTEIAAGTIKALNIAAGTITGSNIAGVTITGSNIAALTITGDKITANTITAGNMVTDTITAASGILANASVTNATIANAAVDTLQLAGHAVTIPTSAFTAGSATITGGVWTTVQSVTWTSSGSPTNIFASFSAGSSGVSTAVNIQFTNGSGTVLQSITAYLSIPYEMYATNFLFMPSAGTETVNMQINPGANEPFMNFSLVALEVKR